MTDEDDSESMLHALEAWRFLIASCKSDCDLCAVSLVDDVRRDQQLALLIVVRWLWLALQHPPHVSLKFALPSIYRLSPRQSKSDQKPLENPLQTFNW
jgi:hypothetical protein